MLIVCCRSNVPDWVQNEIGQKMQQRVWESVRKRLNDVHPGCL